MDAQAPDECSQVSSPQQHSITFAYSLNPDPRVRHVPCADGVVVFIQEIILHASP